MKTHFRDKLDFSGNDVYQFQFPLSPNYFVTPNKKGWNYFLIKRVSRYARATSFRNIVRTLSLIYNLPLPEIESCRPHTRTSETFERTDPVEYLRNDRNASETKFFEIFAGFAKSKGGVEG